MQGTDNSGFAPPGETLLLVNRDRVVSQSSNPARRQIGLQTVPVIGVDDVKMKNVLVPRWRVRQGERRAGQQIVIFPSPLLAQATPSIHLLQFDAKHGSVKLVETAVVSNAVEGPFERAVISQLADGCCQILMVGDDCSTVAEAAQVLLDYEARTDRVAEFPNGKAVSARADCLRTILDHSQVVSPCDGGNSWHISWEAVEMYRHDGLRFRCDGRRNASDIDVTSAWVDIDED